MQHETTIKNKNEITVHTRQVFNSNTVFLENNIFVECTFINCNLIYGGGDWNLNNCVFQGNQQVTFFGNAGNTFKLIQILGIRLVQHDSNLSIMSQAQGKVS